MIINISGYKFVSLDFLAKLKTELLDFCKSKDIKGTILLAKEGINIMLAADNEAIQAFETFIKAKPVFADIAFKYSQSEQLPFEKMLIKIKKEIVTMGQPDINPAQHPAPNLPPKEFKQWLDEGRELVIIDTRNDYEYELGTFEGAIDLHIKNFRSFPAAVANLDDTMKDKPVVVFCTGGIRCEKAAPYMIKQGFKEVYQLEGGILKYFEECDGAHYKGECFVFDDRILVNTKLEEVNR
ncbi:MAG: rhodanese-related sulfurtransferase [Gammaproteobacteria bacterium]